MSTARIEREDWGRQLGDLTTSLGTQKLYIEVEGLDLGSQHEADGAVLRELAYDAAGDAIEIVGDGVRHRIERPVDLWIESAADGTTALSVEDAGQHTHIVKLRPVPALEDGKPRSELALRLRAALQELETFRDEARLKLHLAGREIHDEFGQLEKRWQDLRHRLGPALESFEELADELKESFRRLRDRDREPGGD